MWKMLLDSHEYDADFSTSISRFRYIIKLLSTWKCLDIQKEIITMETIIIISLYLVLSLW